MSYARGVCAVLSVWVRRTCWPLISVKACCTLHYYKAKLWFTNTKARALVSSTSHAFLVTFSFFASPGGLFYVSQPNQNPLGTNVSHLSYAHERSSTVDHAGKGAREFRVVFSFLLTIEGRRRFKETFFLVTQHRNSYNYVWTFMICEIYCNCALCSLCSLPFYKSLRAFRSSSFLAKHIRFFPLLAPSRSTVCVYVKKVNRKSRLFLQTRVSTSPQRSKVAGPILPRDLRPRFLRIFHTPKALLRRRQ